MSRFSAEKGFIHFLIANEDEFYIDSLACLNLNAYVFYELQKEYSGIYSVTKTGDGYQLKNLTKESRRLYQEAEKRGLIAKIFSAGKEELAEENIKIPELQKTVFEERIFKILSQERKQVFVFDVESFSDLFKKSDAEHLEETKKKCVDKNIILITMSGSVNGMRGYLEEKDGIFQSELFPGLMHQEKGKMEKIQTHLQDHMEGCCHFLNRLEQNNIRNMIRRCLLEKKDMKSDMLIQADDYADFIYAWYHSEALRTKTGKILPENKKWLISRLRQEVGRPEKLAELEFWLDLIRNKEKAVYHGETLADIIRRSYSFDREENYLFMDSKLLRQFDRINIPIELQAEEKTKNKIDRIRKELAIAHMGQKELEEDERLQDYFEQLKDATEKNDQYTATHLLGALEYELCICQGEEEEVVLKKRRLWKIILSASSQVYSRKKTEDLYDEYICNYQRQKEKLQERERQTENLSMNQKQEVVAIRRNLERYEKLREVNALARSQMITDINQMLHGIHSMNQEMEDYEELEETIRNVQQQIRESSNEDVSRLCTHPTDLDLNLDLNDFL